MSGEKTSLLLCGVCLVDVESRMDLDGSQRVWCRSCGTEDTLNDAIREAAKHNLDEVIGGTFDGFKSTGAIKVKAVDFADRRYRFVPIDG